MKASSLRAVVRNFSNAAFGLLGIRPFVATTCLAGGLSLLMALAAPAIAQTFEVAASFPADSGNPLAGLLEAPDGSLYGTTRYGGFFGRGSIFRMRRDGEGVTVETVHDFSWPDGGEPFTSLILGGDGYLYGSTYISLLHGYGTVYKLDSSGRLTTLHDFSYTDGGFPSGLAWSDDGFLYGTAGGGGLNGLGTLFRIDGSGQLTTLHDFDGPQGAHPTALVKSSSGAFYGATVSGGVADQGTIFRFDPVEGFRVVHEFAGDEGSTLSAGLIEGADLALYGTSYFGGTHNEGTVFRVDTAGEYTKLHDFDSSIGDGANPEGGLVELPSGTFYGTASLGSGDGTIFRVQTDGTWSIVHEFQGFDGGFPRSGLVRAADGRLYGTTYYGPAQGTIYRVDTLGNFEMLWSFVDSGGSRPGSGVIEASDGKLWGTTTAGGIFDDGTIFHLDSTGSLFAAHDFESPLEGSASFSSLVEDDSGHLLGTSYAGGTDSKGTVYAYDLAGSFAKIHDFAGPEGASPEAGLTDASGALYGVTSVGGDTNQ